MDSKGKGKVFDEMERIPIIYEPKGKKIFESDHEGRSARRRSKHINKIIYYDSDMSSSSHKDDNASPSKQKMVKTSFNHTSFNYSCISNSSRAQTLYSSWQASSLWWVGLFSLEL
jgi:hypothetical protein